MPIDFFQNTCKTESKNNEFGLCDDIPNQKAYIDEDNSGKWIGIVKNPESKKILFYGIDNCANIRKANGNLESTCDGVLKESSYLVFVELKEATRKGWFGEGREQITNTINIFKANYDVADFDSIEGYVCNNLKPRSNPGRATSIQMFKDDTGYILYDKNEIEI
jgi:hypothetical protein